MLLMVSAATRALGDHRLEGGWWLELSGDFAPIFGDLTLRQTADGWQGHVEGGPVDVSVEGKNVRLVIDTRDLQGFTFDRVLTGQFDGERLSGTFEIQGSTYAEEPGGIWSAVRKAPLPPPRPPAPVDLSGIWKPAPGVDFRKYTMDLTPKAQDWHDDYLMHYDQPNVRCVSTGIVAMVAWGFYPMEILSAPDRLTFIYEVESEVRRVFLDDRQPPEFYPTSSMGWSNARWDGSDLVIETQLIEGNVRDFRGEPVSDGARMRERYSLSEDGQTLSAVITLLDPANYRVPPVRRRQWQKSADTVFYPYECDPDSFYRQMYNEGKLDMYFERSERRQIN
ncbi:MAG: hypothetical protein AAGA61_03915 [Pseudomonadota bacterium]